MTLAFCELATLCIRAGAGIRRILDIRVIAVKTRAVMGFSAKRTQFRAGQRELVKDSAVYISRGNVLAGRAGGTGITFRPLWPCRAGITFVTLWSLWPWNVGLAHIIDRAVATRAAAQRVGGAAGSGGCSYGAREGAGGARATVGRCRDDGASSGGRQGSDGRSTVIVPPDAGAVVAGHSHEGGGDASRGGAGNRGRRRGGIQGYGVRAGHGSRTGSAGKCFSTVLTCPERAAKGGRTARAVQCGAGKRRIVAIQLIHHTALRTVQGKLNCGSAFAIARC